MTRGWLIAVVGSILVLDGAARAHEHPETTDLPMVHVYVGLSGTTVTARLEAGLATPVLEPLPEDHTYSDAKFAVLNGTAHNDQYGWIADGMFTPPAGAAIWIEQLSASPGLSVYEGGMRTNMGAWTMAPIFGTAGSSPFWKWSGMMVHNTYAVPDTATATQYSATYRVYVGDAASGAAVPGYTPAEITLAWTKESGVANPPTIGLPLGCGAGGLGLPLLALLGLAGWRTRRAARAA